MNSGNIEAQQTLEEYRREVQKRFYWRYLEAWEVQYYYDNNYSSEKAFLQICRELADVDHG